MVLTQRGTLNYSCIWGRKCVSLKLCLQNAFIFVVANLCSSMVHIRLLQIQHECDNLRAGLYTRTFPSCADLWWQV
jgi:hypothetical protein